MKKRGFTLAEVLITLGIIGVVATLTIPTLMNSYQNTQYVAALKKAYSEFNQALVQVSSDYGCNGNLSCTGLFDPSTTIQTAGIEITKYFKVVKNCGTNAGQGCFSNSVSDNYDGSSARTSYDSYGPGFYRFITIDNISIMFGSDYDSCTTNYGANSMSRVCGYMYIDVNGLKGPNNLGRDLFVFFITNSNGLYPWGGKNHNLNSTSYYWEDINACIPTNPNGLFCAGRVVSQSWQMDY